MRFLGGALCVFQLVAVFGVAGCRKGGDDGKMGRDVTNAADIRGLEKELGVRFPPESRVIGTHRENGMDDYLGVKVEMPAKALAGFLESCPIPKDRYEDGEGGLLGPDDGVWDPNRQPKLRTGQAQLPGARALNVGFDDSSTDVAIVYVVNHGT